MSVANSNACFGRTMLRARSMQTASKRCSRRIDATSRLARKLLLVPLSLTLVADAAAAPRVFKWDDLDKQGRIVAGTVLSPEAESSDQRLKIENRKASPMNLTVLSIDNPQITAPRYRLTGRVRYDNVEGTGYLEMWNYFPGGGQFFSRTLA